MVEDTRSYKKQGIELIMTKKRIAKFKLFDKTTSVIYQITSVSPFCCKMAFELAMLFYKRFVLM